MEQIEFDFGKVTNKPEFKKVYEDMVLIFKKYNLLAENEDMYQFEKELIDWLKFGNENLRPLLIDFCNLQKKYGFNVDLFYNYNIQCGLNNKLGQHYTPQELAVLTARLAGVNKINDQNLFYEPTAGSGNLIWSFWSERQNLETHKDIYFLNDYDTRNIISLVISSAIRGMNCFITNHNTLSGKPMLSHFFMVQSESIFEISQIISQESEINHMDFLKYASQVFSKTDEEVRWMKL